MTVDYRPPAARGELVTPDEAAEMAGVKRNVIDVWASRGDLPRAQKRPVLFWSHDVYDTQRELRRRRDCQGRFAPRRRNDTPVTTVLELSA